MNALNITCQKNAFYQIAETTHCSLPYPSGTRPIDTHTTTRATTYPITHMNPLLSTSFFLELICDRFFTQMKSSTASMNIHTKPERKRKCRRPEITAHNTWRSWETVMMILSETVLSCRAPSSFLPAEAVWGSGTAVWAGTEGEPAEDWCRCWFEPHYSLQDSTDRRQRSTGPKWRTPAPRSHTPNSPDPAVSRSEKTCQSTWVLNLCCSSVFSRNVLYLWWAAGLHDESECWQMNTGTHSVAAIGL